MRASVKFLAPTLGHVKCIALNMREIDQLECRMIGGVEPEEALRVSIKKSTWVKTMEIDGEPVCMFGVAPISLLGETALPWMLGTDGVKKHNRAILRHSRKWVEAMNADYPHLCNVVHADNEISIRWLQWCGFRIQEPTEIQGEPFRAFFKVRAN